MSNVGKYILTGVVSFGAGMGIGYLVAKKALEKRYDEMLDFEVAKLKEFYGIRAHREEEQIESKAIEVVNKAWVEEQAAEKKRLLEELNRNEYSSEETRQSDKDRLDQINSIWNAEQQAEWEAEAAKAPMRKDDDDIFIITFNEYQYEEQDYDKMSVQYFEADDTLVDENDNPINAYSDRVGHDFVNWFGYESGSASIVHVRNRRMEIDFEIARHEGSYTEVILGLPDPETVDKRPKKMRDDD